MKTITTYYQCNECDEVASVKVTHTLNSDCIETKIYRCTKCKYQNSIGDLHNLNEKF